MPSLGGQARRTSSTLSAPLRIVNATMSTVTATGG